MGPTGVIGPIGLGVPRLKVAAPSAFKGTGPIVGTEEDHRVVQDALALQEIHQASNILVEHVHHGGKDGHTLGLPLPFLGIQAVPSRNMVWPGTERPLGRQKARLNLAVMTFFTQLIPATGVASLVLAHGPLRRLQWIVRCIKGRVEQKGLVLLQGLFQELQAKVHDGVGRVKGTPVEFGRHGPLFAVQAKGVVPRKEVGGPGQMSPVALKAKVRRLLIQVPLAHHNREVAGPSEHFGDGRTATQLVAAGLVAVEAGEQGHTRRVTLGRIIEIGEAQAVVRQRVQTRCGDLGAIAAQIGKAEVVRHDEDDIGTLVCGDYRDRRQQQREYKKCDKMPGHAFSFVNRLCLLI